MIDVDGPVAPPRDNGELVFAEPWESRAFGLAVTLHDSGAFTWDEFRAHLVAHIATDRPYYRCWLAALEAVVGERGLLPADELADRAARLADRHDHG